MEAHPPVPQRVLLYSGLALVLVVGAVHLQQYLELLRFVPTIGTMFLINAVAAAVIAAGLLTRFRLPAALAGIGLSVGSLGALAISRYADLFGYSEPTLRPAVAISLVAEVAAAAVLALWVLKTAVLPRLAEHRRVTEALAGS